MTNETKIDIQKRRKPLLRMKNNINGLIL